MATIDNLHTSITQLSRGEAMQLIYDIRASRRTVKKTGKYGKKAVKTAAKKKTTDPMAAFKSMNQAQRDEIIKLLEGTL